MTTYLATDTELRSIANKIREKGNTTDMLTFPSGFVNAIDVLGDGTPKYAIGTTNPTLSTYLTITHNLGFKPNWFVALGTTNSTSYTHGAAYNKNFNATQVYVQGRYNTTTKSISGIKNSASYAYIDETIITVPCYSTTYAWSTSDTIIWVCGE